MEYINSKKTITVMSSKNEPIAYINGGQTIVIETQDCFYGRIRTSQDVLKSLSWDSINPATGPIYINDAEKGDTLKIEIIDIQIDHTAVVLHETEDLNRLGLKDIEKSFIIPIAEGTIQYPDGRQYKTHPMIGVVGTAPEYGNISTTLPGTHGGNIDSNRVTVGNSVFLPVFHNGALLSLGDIHAAMGEGEATGSGYEVSGRATIRVDIIHKFEIKTPIIKTRDSIEIIASAETLDDAANLSVKYGLDFLMDKCRMSSDSAWLFVAAHANVGICQFVNRLKTAKCVFPLQYLPSGCCSIL